MKTFLKVLLTLAILAGLGYGGWYAYNTYLAQTPQEGAVYVQSVSVITGVGPAGQRNRYSGVVEAKNVVKLDPDKDLTVKECFVAAGDKVVKGQRLFSYDVESMQIAFEQLQLDILGLENGIQTGEAKVESLKKKLATVKEFKKYEIQMDIQTEELEVRKKKYELSGKTKQAEDMEEALKNTVVYSPVTGTVRSVKTGDSSGQDYYSYGGSTEDTAYITIVAGNDYCVKGTVSEQTIHTLQEGMDVRILSRVDDSIWPGRIYKINTEETKQNGSRYYYYDSGSGEQASKYDFFVELDNNEGLLMGQHVYIELGSGADQESDALLLPLYYVVENEGQPFVYAADGENRIRIAFPDETVQVGMLASETAYVPEDLGSMEPMDMGGYDMNGMDFEGADLEGADFEGADFEGMDGETDEPQPESQMDIPMGGPIG